MKDIEKKATGSFMTQHTFLFFYCHYRSPSPEPIYSSDGKRLNTREFRTRKKLEEQRHELICKMQRMNPEFKPPADYKYDIKTVFEMYISFKANKINIYLISVKSKGSSYTCQ